MTLPKAQIRQALQHGGLQEQLPTAEEEGELDDTLLTPAEIAPLF